MTAKKYFKLFSKLRLQRDGRLKFTMTPCPYFTSLKSPDIFPVSSQIARSGIGDLKSRKARKRPLPWQAL